MMIMFRRINLLKCREHKRLRNLEILEVRKLDGLCTWTLKVLRIIVGFAKNGY